MPHITTFATCQNKLKCTHPPHMGVKGEPLPVIEIAKRLNREPTAISKHLALLRTSAA